MNFPNLIRVGGVPEHFNLPWHLAIESGVFDDAGIAVEFREVPGGTGEMSRLMRAKELDLALMLTEGAVADILNGAENRLVKVYADSPLIWGIHVAADSEIVAADQIQGRSYAISRFGSGSHMMAIVDAAERGWSTDSMDFRVIKNLDGAREALSEGEVDVFLWEKFMTKPLVDSGEFRRVGQRVVPWPSFVVAARQEILTEQARSIQQVLSIVQSKANELMNNPQAIDVIAKRYGLKGEDTEKWFEQTQWCSNFERPDDALAYVIRYLEKLQLVQPGDHDLEDLWFQL